MNQAAVLDWLGIDVWRLRVPAPIPAATPPVAVPVDEVQPVARAAPLIDVEPMPEPMPEPSAAPSSVPSSLILTLCVPAGGATLPLFTRIARTVPRSVTVVTESTEIGGNPLILWQGRDWRLNDLRQDPALKRRLWRALCLPASSAE